MKKILSMVALIVLVITAGTIAVSARETRDYYTSGSLKTLYIYNDSTNKLEDKRIYHEKVSPVKWKERYLYYSNGNIKSHGTYSTEGVSLELREYYENGQLAALTYHDNTGGRTDRRVYHPNLTPVIWKDRYLYYPNGKIKSYGTYSTEGVSLELRVYNESGQLTALTYHNEEGAVSRVTNYQTDGTKDKETYYNEDGTKYREIGYHKNSAVWDYDIQYQENNIRGSVTYRSDDNLIYKVLNYGEVGMLSEEILYNSDERIDIIKAYNVLGESGEYYIVLNSIKQYENGLIAQTDVYDDEGKYIIETKKYIEGIIERSIFYDEEKSIIDEVKYSQDEIDSITALALLNEGNGVETEKISEDGKNLIYERKLDYKGKEYVYTEIVEALDNEGVIENAENEEGTFTTKGYITSPWSKKKLYSYANYAMFSGYSGDGVFLMWTYTYFKVNRNNTITASRCEADSKKNLHAVGFPKITKSCSLTWSTAKKKGTFISGRGKFNITYSLGGKRTYYIDSFARHEGSTQKGIYIRTKRTVTW